MTVHYTPDSFNNSTFHIFNKVESEKGHLFDIHFVFVGGLRKTFLILNKKHSQLNLPQDEVIQRYILPYVDSKQDAYNLTFFCCENSCFESLKILCARKLVVPTTSMGDYNEEIQKILGSYPR